MKYVFAVFGFLVLKELKRTWQEKMYSSLKIAPHQSKGFQYSRQWQKYLKVPNNVFNPAANES